MHFVQYYVCMVNVIRIHQIVNKIIEIIKLRESLSDHAEYPLNISSQNGRSILRPMFYDSNNESESYQAEDQFIVGTHYLVAPIFTYRATSHSVYLSKFNPGNSK